MLGSIKRWLARLAGRNILIIRIVAGLFAPFFLLNLQAQETRPLVAIHDSELTRALESIPATPPTPNAPGTTGFEWWAPDWHYFVMPEALKEFFLRGRHNLVVTGTHGKTTTTSLLAWILECGGLEPGYMIGGLPRSKHRVGRSKLHGLCTRSEHDGTTLGGPTMCR